MLPCALILRRPGRLISQDASRMQWPVRVAQLCTRKCDEIGLTGTQNGIRLLRTGDSAQSHCGDARLPPNALGKPRLIPGAIRDPRPRDVTAAGTIYYVHPLITKHMRQRYGLLYRPACHS